MSSDLDERLKKSDDMQIEYKIPNIIEYISEFIKTYNDYCHTSLSLTEIMDKVGEKLGIEHSSTRKFLSYRLEESISNETKHIPAVQRWLLQTLAKGYVLSVIKDYNEGKCIEKGKEEDILSEYLYKFIKLGISKAPEGLFHRRIY
jgi:hypothetical protein